MMNVIKTANNVFSGVKLAKNVGGAVHGLAKLAADDSPKKAEYISEHGPVEVVEMKIPCEHRRSNKRILSDIRVLLTLLERIAESENETLISDIKKHQIPERIEELEVLIAQYKKRGFDTLCSVEIRELDCVVEEIECIYNQTKALMLANLLLQPDNSQTVTFL